MGAGGTSVCLGAGGTSACSKPPVMPKYSGSWVRNNGGGAPSSLAQSGASSSATSVTGLAGAAYATGSTTAGWAPSSEAASQAWKRSGAKAAAGA